jgi:hypothetical protein
MRQESSSALNAGTIRLSLFPNNGETLKPFVEAMRKSCLIAAVGLKPGGIGTGG